ncbi:MAG: nitrite reductase small subunit NirD [Anaerolineae bacterium]|nr:nitrite reductase small subunit NirD [Anaerolineae bacterium]
MTISTALKESVIFKSRESWIDVCQVSDILPFTGVAALINGEHVAIFRLAAEDECYAISNYDPFSKAYVLSRGLVGDKNGVVKIASPIYKNTFNLMTGQCLEDENVWLRTWTVRVLDGILQVAV